MNTGQAIEQVLLIMKTERQMHGKTNAYQWFVVVVVVAAATAAVAVVTVINYEVVTNTTGTTLQKVQLF